ncbi:MAG: thiamine biosynthesis protein ThiF, partial [Actinomycetota bacterium]
MSKLTVPAPLAVALEALAGADKVSVIEEWRRFGDAFACRLRITLEGTPTVFVPQETDWHAVAKPDYPLGDLVIFPAKRDGITATFPHQAYNTEGHGPELGPLPWRPGHPCLTHPLAALGGRVREPPDAAERLAWQVGRLQLWLSAAAAGRLQQPGEP